MKFTGVITDIGIDWHNGKHTVVISANEKVIEHLQELQKCEKLSVDIEKWYPHKTSKENRYFWHLCGEISKVMKEPRFQIYLKELRDTGICEYKQLMPRDENLLKDYYRLYEKIGEFEACDENGNVANLATYRCYIGLSKMNTAQASMLIKSAIYDAEAIGVPKHSIYTPEDRAVWGNLLE